MLTRIRGQLLILSNNCENVQPSSPAFARAGQRRSLGQTFCAEGVKKDTFVSVCYVVLWRSLVRLHKYMRRKSPSLILAVPALVVLLQSSLLSSLSPLFLLLLLHS